MKKQILNIGNELSKSEQKSILGGNSGECSTDCQCYWMYPSNDSYGYVCYNPTGTHGVCVPGICWFPPCGGGGGGL